MVSPEGIKVKPFYHIDETEINFSAPPKENGFSILQNIFVHDVVKSNKRALETLNRGAESIRFTIENDAVNLEALMQNLPLSNTQCFFYLPFLSIDFVTTINDFAAKHKADIAIQIDPIGQLVKDGNWFDNLDKDFEKLNQIASKTSIPGRKNK